jgi:DMSO/TMAO reductase YedYZ molybdopterin-dependent catalytic subunit
MDRRQFLAQGLGLTGAVLLGCRERSKEASASPSRDSSASNQSLLEIRGFEDEGAAPMHTLIGEGRGGRRFTDLSMLQPGQSEIPPDRFFVRSRAPAGLALRHPWSIRVDGEVQKTLSLPLDTLIPLARPQGVVCMECSGNDPGGRFGLLSAANWEGVPMRDVLERIESQAKPSKSATRIRVKGMGDGDTREGISWIFRREELASAFLATSMEGAPLEPDQGGPVRLMVPGWYGCACIKWIEGISFLDENAPATPHMKDYAERTHQIGVPELAREYRPARMMLSALPIRLEKKEESGRVSWTLVGLTWGGESADADVLIQTGDGVWRDVEVLARRETPFGWTYWSYAWKPPGTGIYRVRLRPKDPAVRSLRLEEGYYARDCRIDEV